MLAGEGVPCMVLLITWKRTVMTIRSEDPNRNCAHNIPETHDKQD
jgi:hypothetical protein